MPRPESEWLTFDQENQLAKIRSEVSGIEREVASEDPAYWRAAILGADLTAREVRRLQREVTYPLRQDLRERTEVFAALSAKLTGLSWRADEMLRTWERSQRQAKALLGGKGRK